MKLSLKNIRGFTLSELMIASAILLVAILGLLAVLINCIILNEANNNLIIAVNDAQYVLEQIKGLAYADIAAYIAPVFSNLNSETISLTHNYIDPPNNLLIEVTVYVGWIERQRNKNFQLSTRIAR